MFEKMLVRARKLSADRLAVVVASRAELTSAEKAGMSAVAALVRENLKRQEAALAQAEKAVVELEKAVKAK